MQLRFDGLPACDGTLTEYRCERVLGAEVWRCGEVRSVEAAFGKRLLADFPGGFVEVKKSRKRS